MAKVNENKASNQTEKGNAKVIEISGRTVMATLAHNCVVTLALTCQETIKMQWNNVNLEPDGGLCFYIDNNLFSNGSNTEINNHAENFSLYWI